MRKIAIIGCGFTGLLTSVVLSHKHMDKTITLYDEDRSRIDRLNKGNHYIDEPLFQAYFDIARNIKLTYSIEDLSDSDVVFISVDTLDNEGKPIVNRLHDIILELNQHIKQKAAIIITGIHSVGTTANLTKNELREDFIVVHIPMFATKGEAIANLLNPRYMIFGYTKRTQDITNLLQGLFYYVKYENIIKTDSSTSELIKLASNFMLAQRVATINAFEYIAKERALNIQDVSKALTMDPRLGCKYLSPSAGYGGDSFRRCVNNLSNICDDTNFKHFFSTINKINDYHMLQIVDKIGKDKNVLFLGYGYKEKNNCTIESPTQFIIDYLPKSVKYDIYDIHCKQYSEKPTGNYDLIILMLDEKEYKDIASNYPRIKIIDVKHIMPDLL